MSQEVAVYVKLPDGFFISTPVGHYNPDWAIAFYEGTVKHIYFVAETKGALGSAHLRPTEKAKIECAKKHFACIFDTDKEIKYDVVSSYNELLNKLNIKGHINLTGGEPLCSPHFYKILDEFDKIICA